MTMVLFFFKFNNIRQKKSNKNNCNRTYYLNTYFFKLISVQSIIIIIRKVCHEIMMSTKINVNTFFSTSIN